MPLQENVKHLGTYLSLEAAREGMTEKSHESMSTLKEPVEQIVVISSDGEVATKPGLAWINFVESKETETYGMLAFGKHQGWCFCVKKNEK